MIHCIANKIPLPTVAMGLATTTTASASSTHSGFDRLRHRVPDLRKMAVVVVVTIALGGVLPENSASDVRRYNSPVHRQKSRDQADRILDLLQMIKKRRSSQCIEAKKHCYSSKQCCSGHVCVIDDEYLANNPETPGMCFREKDLTLCSMSSDCPTRGSRCLSLGRTGQRYCVTLPASAARRVTMTSPDNAVQQLVSKGGGLGAPCFTSSQCDERAYDGMTLLCCQLVHMHRQGSRQICDRYRPGVSACI